MRLWRNQRWWLLGRSVLTRGAATSLATPLGPVSKRLRPENWSRTVDRRLVSCFYLLLLVHCLTGSGHGRYLCVDALADFWRSTLADTPTTYFSHS